MIFTFYSYKGGVGRTMALANVAELLYQRGFKVLMVDFDLEAPGLERFFKVLEAFYQPNEVIEQRGVIDLLLSYKKLCSISNLDSENISEDVAAIEDKFPFPVEPITNFIVPLYEENEQGGSLFLIPAGYRREDKFSNYAKNINSFDWNNFYDKWNGEQFFEWFRKEVVSFADVVLIDSRTGITEMGGVCTYQLADVVVMFLIPNDQNLDGTLKMAQSLSNPDLIEKGRKGRDLSLVIVPSRVDNGEKKLLDNFQEDFEQKLNPFISDELKFKKSAFVDLKVPYVPFYAFKEKVAVRDAEKASASDLSVAYENLTVTIVQLASKNYIIGLLIKELFSKKQVLDRSEYAQTTLRILKKFNLKPDEPPNDFHGIYVYTLIKYGFGKPKVIFDLFQEEKIQQEFQNNFNLKKPLNFLEGLDDYIENFAIVDEIKQQNIDYKKEIEKFAALFMKIAKGDRIITETLQDHYWVDDELKSGTSSPNKESFDVQKIDKYLEKVIWQYQNWEVVKKNNESFLLEPMERADLYKYYVQSYCIDKQGNEQLLDDLLAKFIEDSKQTFLTLLGDFGTGKSSFSIHYFIELAKKYLDHKNERIPIFISLKDYKGKLNIEDFMVREFYEKFKIMLNFSIFQQLALEDKFIFFIDGFDEMASLTDREITFQNFKELTKLSENVLFMTKEQHKFYKANKVFLTSRTHYFLTESEEKTILQADYTILYRNYATKSNYEITRIKLKEFNDNQIREYIQKHTNNEEITTQYLKLIDNTYNLKELSTRPSLLEMIIKTMPILREKKNINASDIYREYTNIWIERDDWRFQMKPQGKRSFMWEIASKMFELGGDFSLHYSKLDQPNDEHLKPDFEVSDQDYYQYESTTCTFLNRDSDGNYKFIHKSFMEYFVAESFYCHLIKDNTQIIDYSSLNAEIKFFLKNIIALHKHELDALDISNFDLSQIDLSYGSLNKTNFSGVNLRDADLRGADLRDADLHGADLRGTQIDKETVLDDKWNLVWKIINQGAVGQDLSGINLCDAILCDANLRDANLRDAHLRVAYLRDADLRRTNLSGANLSGAIFSDANLRDANLRDANLRDAIFSGANLSGTNLRGVIFSGVNLSGANLSGTNLRGAIFSGADLSGANLSGTNLRDADLRRANLSDAIFSGANLTNADLRSANLSIADLSIANLSGADLSGANLSGANLSGAKGLAKK